MTFVSEKPNFLNPTISITCLFWTVLFLLQAVFLFQGLDGCCTKGHYRPKIEKNSTLYNIKMEMIRQELVEKMGLQRSSLGRSLRNNIPDAILKEFWEESQKYEQQGKTVATPTRSVQVKKLMLHAKRASKSGCPGCVKFTHQSSSLQAPLVKAYLWIFQGGKSSQKNRVVDVYIRTKTKLRTLLVREKLIEDHQGWYRINLNGLSKWTSSTIKDSLKVDLLLQILCVSRGCNKILIEEHLPYLDISEIVEVNQRSRRTAVKCAATETSCCLDDFEVDFQKYIGDLANAIIMLPKKVNVGQCRGSCDDPHTASDAHSGIVQSSKIKDVRRASLCCVPHKYKPFATLYIKKIQNGTDEIVIRNINDMVVTECGCA